jgi:hypothetical protein
MNRKLRLAISGFIALLLGIAWFLSYSAVDNQLSDDDSRYAALFLKNIPPLPDNPSYEDELVFIESVQRAVLGVSPQKGPIPDGAEREPKDLYLAKTGYCYDRSRTIEKLLRLHGFDVRHIFMISNEASHSTLRSLLTPGVYSHAVTEVLTQKGWLIVGSNSVWVSTDVDNLPVSIKELKFRIDNSIPLNLSSVSSEKIYYKPFGYVYGLYSRHGKFYPPFNDVPDVNYAELTQNIDN